MHRAWKLELLKLAVLEAEGKMEEIQRQLDKDLERVGGKLAAIGQEQTFPFFFLLLLAEVLVSLLPLPSHQAYAHLSCCSFFSLKKQHMLLLLQARGRARLLSNARKDEKNEWVGWSKELN